MKNRHILSLTLIFTCVSTFGQSLDTNAIQQHFAAYLQHEQTVFSKSKPLPPEDITLSRKLVWEAWRQANIHFEEDKLPSPRSLSYADTLHWPLPQVLEPHAVMPYCYGTKGTKPTNGWPLYIYLHGSGAKEKEWSTGYYLCSRFADSPSLYFIPQIPNEGEYYRWWQRSKLFAWDRLLRQSLLNDSIDPRRIYLFGISEGGYGSQRLASYYADYLAAVGPMAGGEIPSEAPAENCGQLGFSLRTGAKDYMFARNLLTQRTLELFDSLHTCYPTEYRHHVVLVPGRGHSIDYSYTTPWMSQFTRTLHPDHFIWEDFPLDGVYRNGFYNIAIHQRDTTGGNTQTRYEMNIKSNTISLTIDRVSYEVTEREPQWNIPIKHHKHYTPATKGHFTLYLSENMVNLNQEIILNVNGKCVYKGLPKAELRHLVNSCATFYDPERLYPIGIEVKL